LDQAKGIAKTVIDDRETDTLLGVSEAMQLRVLDFVLQAPSLEDAQRTARWVLDQTNRSAA
jgi:hypothetical protein